MASYFSLLALLLGLSMVFAGGYDYGSYGHDYGYNKVAPHAEPYGAKPYQHYGHYHYAKTTCADHYKPGVKNGHFKVYSVYHMKSMKVYCDFTSEPGMAYTMVMASTFAGRSGAVVATASIPENPFQEVALPSVETATHKYSVNPSIPNKYAYRQAKVDMERISKASKVWRLTCGDAEDKTFEDYIRVKISEFNPVTANTGQEENCKTAEYVNMGPAGSKKSCAYCKVNIIQRGLTSADPNKLLNINGGDNNCNAGLAVTDTLLVSGCGTAVDDPKVAALWFGKPVH